MAQSQIAEIAQTQGWRGTPNHKISEPSHVSTLPVIDNSVPYQSNVRTSVDCYVSGSYVTRNGKTFEVTQRYTIFVAYSRETQAATMTQVRARIVDDFQAKYGRTFNVTNAFVPGLPVPKADTFGGIPPGGVAPLELYKGTDMFKSMMAYEKARFEVAGEHLKAKTNIQSIRQRYKMKR